MLTYERLQRIKQILYEKKTVDVYYLSSIFNVSESTIRRDLDKLEKQKFLKKTYGGAVLNVVEPTPSYEEMIDRQVIDDEAMIAAIAASLIQNNDAIFLSGGSICQKIVPHLTDISTLTIVTNDILVASLLYCHSSINLLLIGGQFTGGASQTSGELAQLCLENVLVNKAFISVDGIDLTYGITVSDLGISQLYKKLFNITNEVIVLADFSKFNKITLSKVSPINTVNAIVTNQNIENIYKEFCISNNIKLFTSFDIK